MSCNSSTIGSATMDNKLYNSSATVQLAAHVVAKSDLRDCIVRILRSHPLSRQLRITDLGSAGGVNSIRLLRYIESILHENGEYRPVEYIFEDLPTSDFNELVKTIHESQLSNQFYPMCIGKSFYKKLFPPNSVHLSLSYITLHWLSYSPGKTSYCYIIPDYSRKITYAVVVGLSGN